MGCTAGCGARGRSELDSVVGSNLCVRGTVGTHRAGSADGSQASIRSRVAPQSGLPGAAG